MKNTTELMWKSGVLGVALASSFWIMVMAFGHKGNGRELSCIDNKLYEVSHEGNITIYKRAFKECEVSK